MILQQKQSKIIIIILMMVLLIGAALPGYINNRKWPWMDMPQLKTLPQLQAIRIEGLTIPGWPIVKIESIGAGNKQWLKQEVKRKNQKAIVLLFPQNYYKDQPQLEWMDLNGLLGWKTDDFSYERFSIKSTSGEMSPVEVEVQFFRAWTTTQTWAVAQWYAWPQGGNPSPSRWFWADRAAQLSRNRAPWVGVSLLIPIKPLDNIKDVWPVAVSLGEGIQASLMAEALAMGGNRQQETPK